MNEVLRLVSVGIPTYNRPEGLDRTLQYLQQQSYQHLDIIVSDNCSTDARVREVIERNAKVDGRIRYTIQEKNIEAEPNFNYVYHQKKGTYFMWMSDDDTFDLNYIETCVRFLEANSDYMHCAGITSYFKGNKTIFKEKNLSLESDSSLIRMLTYLRKVTKNGVFYGVFRSTPIFENPIGKFIGSDWVHITRLALLGKVRVLETTEAHRDMDGGSATRKRMANRWKLNKIQTLFFEVITSKSVAYNIFAEKCIHERSSTLLKVFLPHFIFVMLNVKFFLYAITRRIVKNQ